MIPVYDTQTVIKALKHCAYGERGCNGCPVGKDCKGTINKAMTLAIEFLEADKEESRIMTDSEVLAWSKLPDRGRTPIVVEYKNHYIAWMCTVDKILTPMMIMADYIRFWTGMPSIEQQKAVKWEDNVTQ